VLERSRMSPTRTSAAEQADRYDPDGAVELPRSCTPSCSRSTSSPRQGFAAPTGRPVAGKTRIAKRFANIAGQEENKKKKIAAARGDYPKESRGFLPDIKGPELLNKFVGETERHIRRSSQRPGRRLRPAPR